MVNSAHLFECCSSTRLPDAAISGMCKAWISLAISTEDYRVDLTEKMVAQVTARLHATARTSNQQSQLAGEPTFLDRFTSGQVLFCSL